MPMLRAAVETVAELKERGIVIDGKRVMEVGSGRRLDMLVAFYLCGASSVHTFDLNPYLREELVMASIAAMLRNAEELARIFETVTEPGDFAKRLDNLAAAGDLAALRAKAGIQYHAPADASRTGLANGSIDLQFSYTVFEHIPEPEIKAILRECSRLLSPGGVACHHIDPSDHCAHDDRSISSIHFLRFEEKEWSRYNDNQFAYHNRLRRNDYDRLYEESGHEIFHSRPYIDAAAMAEIKSGFPLATPFQGQNPENLCTVGYRIYSRPRGAAKGERL